MRAHDGYSHSSPTAANSSNFRLEGGVYVIDAVANFNSGSITLQRLGPDGTTFLTAATALSATGASSAVCLPTGTYRFLVASASALSVSVIRVPGE